MELWQAFQRIWSLLGLDIAKNTLFQRNARGPCCKEFTKIRQTHLAAPCSPKGAADPTERPRAFRWADPRISAEPFFGIIQHFTRSALAHDYG